jgi:NAD(P)H-hydrate repair Nnr-like enzyme with NAD(P)H-hydrate epimerase domain
MFFTSASHQLMKSEELHTRLQITRNCKERVEGSGAAGLLGGGGAEGGDAAAAARPLLALP